VRTVTTNTFIASCIRNIEFYGDELAKRLAIWETPQTDGGFEPELELLRRGNFPDLDLWEDALVKGNIDAFVALLLYQLPFLETVVLGHIFQDDSKLTGAMFHHTLFGQSPNPLPKFSYLQSIRYTADRPFRAVSPWGKADLDLDLYNLLPLLYIPSVEALEAIFPRMKICQSSVFTWPNIGIAPVASSLTTLILKESSITEENLKKLLMATPSLRYLRYERCDIEDMDCESIDEASSTCLHERVKLSNALEVVRKTLETLELHISIYDSLHVNIVDCYCNERWTVMTPLPSFKNFPRLKRLQVPWLLLLGPDPETAPQLTDLLPPQLEQFIFSNELLPLRDYEWNKSNSAPLVEAIRRLFHPLFREHSPRLSEVAMNLRYGNISWPDYRASWWQFARVPARSKRYPWDLKCRSAIEDICKAAGGISMVVAQDSEIPDDVMALLGGLIGTRS
jgi:hypothetical protein